MPTYTSTSPALPAPRISVIIATCRRPALALDAIRSVVENGYPDFEVVVVDQDPTLELHHAIRDAFPGEERIRYHRLDQAILSRARNVGLARSTGEIVHFLDDDAELFPGSLKAYAEAFQSPAPRPGVVAGRLLPRWGAARPAWLPTEKEYLLGIYDRGDRLAPMPGQDLPIGANFAVLRSVASEVGPFDERVGYSYARRTSLVGGEDSLFCLRAKRAGHPVLYQPAAAAWHRISPAKLSPAAFLRRNYWEGVTTISLMHLTGEAPRERAAAIARWNRREIARQVLHLARRRHGRWRLFSRIEWMRALSSCAYCLGILRGCAQLRRHGALP